MFKKTVLLFIISLMTIQCELPSANDIIPPIPVLIYPYEGAVISTNIEVRVEASDNKDVKKVWVYLDGKFIGETSSAPYLIPLNIDTLKDGLTHKIQAVASDKEDNNGYSAITTFIIAETQDIVDPTVLILNPQNGQTVEDSISIIALAQDDRSIKSIEFFIDGRKLEGEITMNSSDTKNVTFSIPWATSQFEDSTNHTVYAKVTDGGNNTAISPVVTVSVFPTTDTTPPAGLVTYPLNGQVVFGTIDITVEASDDKGIAKVEFYIDGDFKITDSNTPFRFSWDTAPYADDGTHSIYAKIFDVAGNNFTTAIITVIVSSGSSDDVTAPTVLILYPVTGTNVTGTVAIRADASDNVAVTSVEFFIDGNLEGTGVLSNGTWLYSWNSLPKADSGSHTIYLKAYDAAGNIGTSGITTVTVLP